MCLGQTSSRLPGEGWALTLGEGSCGHTIRQLVADRRGEVGLQAAAHAFSSFLYSFCSRSVQAFLAMRPCRVPGRLPCGAGQNQDRAPPGQLQHRHTASVACVAVVYRRPGPPGLVHARPPLGLEASVLDQKGHLRAGSLPGCRGAQTAPLDPRLVAALRRACSLRMSPASALFAAVRALEPQAEQGQHKESLPAGFARSAHRQASRDGLAAPGKPGPEHSPPASQPLGPKRRPRLPQLGPGRPKQGGGPGWGGRWLRPAWLAAHGRA